MSVKVCGLEGAVFTHPGSWHRLRRAKYPFVRPDDPAARSHRSAESSPKFDFDGINPQSPAWQAVMAAIQLLVKVH
jgi:hypothetical protein